MMDDFKLMLSLFLQSSLLFVVQTLLDFNLSRLLRLPAIFLPNSIAWLVKLSILLFIFCYLCLFSKQQDSNMPNNSENLFYSAYNNNLLSYFCISLPLLSVSLLKVSCSLFISSFRVELQLISKSQPNDLSRPVTYQRKLMIQFYDLFVLADSDAIFCLMAWREGLLLAMILEKAGFFLVNSCIFFFKKLFSLLSCSISMRQHLSSSISSSESLKLCQNQVLILSSSGKM